MDCLPTYAMCAMLLPVGYHTAVDGKRRAFMWSGEEKTSGAQCLVAWDKVTTPREHGGLGIRDLALQNNCLLLKLIHRLHRPGESSWAQWVHEHADVSSLTGELDGSDWATLRQLLPAYQALTTVKLGNGKSTSFWNDWWLQAGRLAELFPALASHATNHAVSVHRVLSEGFRTHLVPRLSRVAEEEFAEVQDLLSDVVLSEDLDEHCSELLDQHGQLKASRVYKLVKSANAPDCNFAKFVWHNRAPPKVQFFAWLVVQERIQCRGNLHAKNIVDDDKCELCSTESEDTFHILFGCSFVQTFWNAISVEPLQDLSARTPWRLRWPTSTPAQHRDTLTLLCLSQIWKHRNAVVFRGEAPNLSRLLRDCREEASLWRCRLRQDEAAISSSWCSIFNPM